MLVPGIPGLLVSTDFTSTAQSYTVHLTDLANLWTETLDKKPIIMRALKEDTSIDPTDGPDQIRKLLDLLRAAFDPSAPEHGDTSLTLISGTDGEDSLEIHVSVVLPKPLRPLKWPMYLKMAPRSGIATELVLPLVQAHQNRAREVDELVAALKEKDGVIAKLVDKLEATGTGLENVFNSLSGRRKVTKALAEERVKGLAPFRASEFRKRADDAAAEGGSDDVVALLDSVFGAGPGLPSGSALDIGESPALNDWWTKLGRAKSAALVSRAKEKKAASPAKEDSPTASEPDTPAKPKTKAEKRRRVVEDDGSTADEDEDFQVQATPPKNQKSAHNTRSSQVVPDDDDDEDFQVQATPPKHQKPALHTRPRHVLPDDDDETASEDEDEAIPDSMPTAKTKQKGSQPSGSKLGTIGGKKQPPPRKPSTPSPPRTRHHSPTPPRVQNDDNGSDTASDPDDMDTSPPPPPPPPKPSTQPARRGGLGRIGGGARPPPKAATPEPAPSQSQSQVTPRRSRLGHIGRKVDDSQDSGGRGRSSVKDEEVVVEEKRETSMERADRKRAELRAEVERKAHQPVKKKRKF